MEVSLKEHFELLLKEQDKRIEQESRAAREAVQKAELAIDKRLDLLNEFRAQAVDESVKYVRKDQMQNMVERLAALESSRDRVYGGILIVALIGVVNLVKLFWS
jgi:hypothetical protein